jgi:hypothetical protein
MNSRQDQRVSEGGAAILSGRDTIVNQGLSPDDMRAIVESLSDQMPKLAQTAAALMEVRLESFKKEILERFEQDADTKREAFADPDFQHVLLDAQRAYARTGDTGTHGTLIDLIATRSSESTGSRRAFAINESIAIVSQLTRSEISELAFCFFVRNTQNSGVNNLESFCNNINHFIDEFLDDIEMDDQSYEYLVAQRCATLSMGEIRFTEIWRRVYPGLFMKGFSQEEVDQAVGGYSPNLRSLLVRSVFNPQNYQPCAISLDVWLRLREDLSINETHRREFWEKAVATLADDTEILNRLRPLCPRVDEAIEKWNSSPMKSLELTTIGKTIGHARLSQVPAFGTPDLSIWIR